MLNINGKMETNERIKTIKEDKKQHHNKGIKNT